MVATGILFAMTHTTRLRQSVALLAVCSMLGSCASGISFNDYDENAGVPKKEYEKLLGRRAPETDQVGPSAEPPIPNFQSVVAAPAAPDLADARRVSIAVTEATPVRDILIELSRKAGVDLEMDPRVSGGIIMTATDRPFVQVVERIAELAELRYRLDRNTLRIELDDPYLEQYRMDVLNLSRNATSSASSSTDASSAAAAIGASSGGGGNASRTSVESTTRADFWGQIGTNIEQILAGIQSRRGSAQMDIAATFVPSPEAPAAAPAPRSPAAALPPAAAAGLAAATGGAGAAGSPAAPAVAPPEGGASARQEGASGASRGAAADSRYSINAQAGIITVFASQRQHHAVERYLREVRAAVTQQVLIEAKVLEVTLNDQYRAGVDWNAVLGPRNGSEALNITSNFTRNVVPPSFTGPTLAANWANSDGDLSLGVQLVKQFGTVRTLSSPRLTVLNNQVAMLKVARNQVFFELDVQQTEGTANAQPRLTVNSNIKTIPVGLILNVQPAVDILSKRISLSMRPSITRITGFVNDPSIAVISALLKQTNPELPQVSSPVPIIEVREMDSLVAMESGQTVVLGGLMQETNSTIREGVPGVMDVPLVGQALAQNVKENEVTELVIFIRATLANGPDTISDEDIRLYKTFAPDPRPVVF